MTYKNRIPSTPNRTLLPATNVRNLFPTKSSNYLDVSPTVLKPSDQDPMTILGAVLRSTRILDDTNTAVELTEEFNLIVYNTT